MNLNSLPNYEKTNLFIAHDKNFYKGGILKIEFEKFEYKKLGIAPPICAMHGSYIHKKMYTMDPMADSIDEMLSRTIIW